MTNHYGDIIGLPHHVSKKHPQMALRDRAAQFSSFAALTGYEATLKETARLTSSRITLSEDEQAALDERLRIAASQSAQGAELSITYFVPDKVKDGGAYITVTGTLKRIDELEQAIWLTNGTKIPIEDIVQIEGNVLDSEF